MTTFVEREDASVRLKNLTLVERRRGPVQTAVVYQHPTFGRVLIIDGELQNVEAWQALYHEPLVHLPASFIPVIRSVLILGGGDLFAAREALKYRSIKRVTLIEHDNNIIDLTKLHYKHARTVLSDPRFVLKIGDARAELHVDSPKYDLIISDCFDLSASSCPSSPYEGLQRRLTTQGICSDMVYRHVFEKRTVRRSLKKLAGQSRLVLGLMAIPEYPGMLHLHTLWGRNRYLDQSSRTIRNELQKRVLATRRGMTFEFYDPEYRSFFMYVPPYVHDLLS